jgi:hypothetical protein
VQKLRSQDISEDDTQIDLGDVLDDSPMFRMKLKVAENVLRIQAFIDYF